MRKRNDKRRVRALAIGASLPWLALAACTQSGTAGPPQISANEASIGLPHHGPSRPKVPFGNQPCQSLTQGEQKQIEMRARGYARPVLGKPDRAPADLPFDNTCVYNEFSVGYVSQLDYAANSSDPSTEHAAPADLPGAFYGKHGTGLWFRKNGYYVNIEGYSELLEPAARVIAAKL